MVEEAIALFIQTPTCTVMMEAYIPHFPSPRAEEEAAVVVVVFVTPSKKVNVKEVAHADTNTEVEVVEVVFFEILD